MGFSLHEKVSGPSAAGVGNVARNVFGECVCVTIRAFWWWCVGVFNDAESIQETAGDFFLIFSILS